MRARGPAPGRAAVVGLSQADIAACHLAVPEKKRIFQEQVVLRS